MLSLLEKLKRDRDACFERYKRLENNLTVCQRELELCDAEYGDFNVAIAALEPAPTDEQPELFEDEKAVAREQLEREDDASEFAEPMPDPEFIELDEQTCEPVEEAPALNEAMQDEREQLVEDGYAPVTNPEADAWSAPVETTPGTLAEYVPPTNPDADFWARTLTEQPKPEPFRFPSIFRREKEEA